MSTRNPVASPGAARPSAVPGSTDWLNVVAQYDGDPTGASDSTSAIQAALDAANHEGTVFLPSGRYVTSAPLMIPAGVRLLGNHGRFPAADQPGSGGSVIAASPSFAGPALIQLTDSALRGHGGPSADQEIAGLTLDATAIKDVKDVKDVDGIHAIGRVTGVYVHDVCLLSIPGDGVSPGYYAARNPFSWRFHRVNAVGAGGVGFHVANFTDTTFLDCEAIACGGDGWYIDGNAGCVFSACRAEWNQGFGFHLIGGTLPNTVFTGCTTDSNNRSGFRADTGGGYGGILLSGCRFGRDGRNDGNGGGGYAGVDINGTSIQVLIDGCLTSVGRDDDGTGQARPQYGISVQSAAYVQVRGGIWWGATAGWYAGSGNRIIRREGLDIASGTDSLTLAAPTASPGVNAGASAPVPVLSPGANDERGTVSFGTGSGPGAGEMCKVTFAAPFAAPPALVISAGNDATARLAPYCTVTETGFSVQAASAPTASQGSSTYFIAWIARA